jgi:hypothetical protein
MRELRTDIAIFGSGMEGLSCAIRAAREGLSVIVVTTNALGGILPSLGAIETHYTGSRSPVFEEFRERITGYYAEKYGEGSMQYQDCVNLESGNPFITFEPHAAGEIIRRMIEAEKNITVFKQYRLKKILKRGNIVTHAVIEEITTRQEMDIAADTFVDAACEGDLIAAAGVEYRTGRESKDEFGEAHGGKLFTQWIDGLYPDDAVRGRLNIIPKRTTRGFFEGSTGEGDGNIQEYSYRFCLTRDPANRLPVKKPETYNAEYYLPILAPVEEKRRIPMPFQHRFIQFSLEDMVKNDHIIHGHKLPNMKRSWNASNLTGKGLRYPEASEEERAEIRQTHIGHGLGLLYFLQHDKRVPPAIQNLACEWGLAKDEFTDTDNIPGEMYIREARRIRGRYIFSEKDCIPLPGGERTPVHYDSIAITEFPLDSLACTTDKVPGSLNDGQFFVMDITRPAMVPWRILLPREYDNLISLTAPSVTHVAWGTVRQTPTLMHIGESAGFAAALAKELSLPVAAVPVGILQQRLVENRLMISFFNDFDMSEESSWAAAVQYFSTKGFFCSYNAEPRRPLTRRLAKLWAEAALRPPEAIDGLTGGSMDEFSRRVLTAENEPGAGIQAAEFYSLLKKTIPIGTAAAQPILRGGACELLYNLVKERKNGYTDVR